MEANVRVSGAQAELGQVVPPGSVVVVGNASLCEIRFGGNIMRMYENTIATVRISAEAQSVQIETGAIGAAFAHHDPSTKPPMFSFKTPTATGSVRGTVFFLHVEDRDNTYLCTCAGTLSVHSPGVATPREVTATHHSSLRFARRTDGTVEVGAVDLLYHSDEEMESIARRIGAEIDWKQRE